MTTKEDLMQFAHDVASSPKLAGPVATMTTGAGLNEIFGWVESGIGFIATIAGLMVTVALWRKLQLERREAELRIAVLERRLELDPLHADGAD